MRRTTRVWLAIIWLRQFLVIDVGYWQRARLPWQEAARIRVQSHRKNRSHSIRLSCILQMPPIAFIRFGYAVFVYTIFLHMFILVMPVNLSNNNMRMMDCFKANVVQYRYGWMLKKPRVASRWRSSYPRCCWSVWCKQVKIQTKTHGAASDLFGAGDDVSRQQW